MIYLGHVNVGKDTPESRYPPSGATTAPSSAAANNLAVLFVNSSSIAAASASQPEQTVVLIDVMSVTINFEIVHNQKAPILTPMFHHMQLLTSNSR